MRLVRLPHTDLQCSALGFGCNSLTTLNDRRKALDLLTRAFDVGITHYDVARAYGSGLSERLVGEFLRSRRDKVTVATKFGLRPSAVMPRSATAITIAKRLLRLVPAIDRRIRNRLARTVQPPTFGIRESAASLETSLRELGTDYVDALLIHEGRIGDAQNDELKRFLEDQRARGTVRYWGLAGSYTHLEGDAERLPPRCAIVQFDNDVLVRQRRRIAGLEERAVITYSPLAPLAGLVAGAAASPQAARVIGDMTGLDPSRRDDAAQLLLGFALADNREGVVLIGTTSQSHVAANASIADGPLAPFAEPALVTAVARLARPSPPASA